MSSVTTGSGTGPVLAAVRASSDVESSSSSASPWFGGNATAAPSRPPGELSAICASSNFSSSVLFQLKNPGNDVSDPYQHCGSKTIFRIRILPGNHQGSGSYLASYWGSGFGSDFTCRFGYWSVSLRDLLTDPTILVDFCWHFHKISFSRSDCTLKVLDLQHCL